MQEAVLQLLLDRGVPYGRFLRTAVGAPLGTVPEMDRSQGTLRLTADSTMLLFTDGLVQSRSLSRAAGLARLRVAAAEGPPELDDCEHVLRMQRCSPPRRRHLPAGVSLLANSVPAQTEASERCRS